jgi:hypothetical protein
MGFVLGSIIKEEVIQDTESIDANWQSPRIDMDDREGEFSISFFYENGSSVDMTLKLQISSDGENFADLADTDQSITDSSGMHIWDIAGSGASYCRVSVEVGAGSIDITRILYVAKQRH